MMHKEATATALGRSLDKLAERGTESKCVIREIGKFVAGKGTRLDNPTQLRKWAQKKIIGQRTFMELIKIAKRRGELDLAKCYTNSLFCFQQVTSAGNRVYGKYCKNRQCLICNGIRKADTMKRYLPEINKWEFPHFLTLTVKSPNAAGLKRRIDEMFIVFQRIIDKYRKQYQRGKGIKLIGIKSLESNFNPQTRTYNPHFHILLPTYEMGKILLDEWIKEGQKQWGGKAVLEYGQKLVKVKNPEKHLIETIKYATKTFTSKDVADHKLKVKTPRKIYVKAYHNIISAMKGKRIFDRFGFDLPPVKKEKTFLRLLNKPYKEWRFKHFYNDWLELEGEQVLSNYQPEKELLWILENSIEKTLG